MTKYQRIGLRVAISACVGILVAATATVVAWRNIGGMSQVRPEQWATRDAIFETEEMVRMYHATTKALPKSLEELPRSDDFQGRFRRDEKGRPLDGWGRPLLYSTDGTKYTITSFGRDSKPGGGGLDYDLSNRTTWPCADALPTFVQFLAHPVTRGVILACLTCGVLAFLLSLAMVDLSILQRYGVLPLVIQLGVTILATLFVAFLMSFAEIPNYH
jgi:hypothetical protein